MLVSRLDRPSWNDLRQEINSEIYKLKAAGNTQGLAILSNLVNDQRPPSRLFLRFRRLFSSPTISSGTDRATGALRRTSANLGLMTAAKFQHSCGKENVCQSLNDDEKLISFLNLPKGLPHLTDGAGRPLGNTASDIDIISARIKSSHQPIWVTTERDLTAAVKSIEPSTTHWSAVNDPDLLFDFLGLDRSANTEYLAMLYTRKDLLMFRPTVFSAGAYAEHFPSAGGAFTARDRRHGRSMYLNISQASDVRCREWIHSKWPTGKQVVSGGRFTAQRDHQPALLQQQRADHVSTGYGQFIPQTGV